MLRIFSVFQCLVKVILYLNLFYFYILFLFWHSFLQIYSKKDWIKTEKKKDGMIQINDNKTHKTNIYYVYIQFSLYFSHKRYKNIVWNFISCHLFKYNEKMFNTTQHDMNELFVLILFLNIFGIFWLLFLALWFCESFFVVVYKILYIFFILF